MEKTTPEKKQIVFSAIQPSGSLTLGNYLGAVKNWVRMQENPEYNCIYALADLHTITVRQDPAQFRRNVIDMYASIMACGVDVEKAPFFGCDKDLVTVHIFSGSLGNIPHRSQKHTGDFFRINWKMGTPVGFFRFT